MILKHCSLGLFCLGMSALASEKTPTAEHVHWSYAGAGSPAHWGTLDPKNSLCSEGQEQSPIDLKWSKPKSDRKINIAYTESTLKIIDNGHTIQLNFDPGSHLEISGQKYQLLQMHFHAHSEHTLSGKNFPLEAHLVHKDAQGQLAVLGVMIKEGQSNPWIEKVWSNLPPTKNQELVTVNKVSPNDFLPKILTHYHYMGSLTTPPCSEGVNWNVLNTPIEFSAAQIKTFTDKYDNNFRPIQALHWRKPANY